MKKSSALALLFFIVYSSASLAATYFFKTYSDGEEKNLFVGVGPSPEDIQEGLSENTWFDLGGDTLRIEDGCKQGGWWAVWQYTWGEPPYHKHFGATCGAKSRAAAMQGAYKKCTEQGACDVPGSDDRWSVNASSAYDDGKWTWRNVSRDAHYRFQGVEFEMCDIDWRSPQQWKCEGQPSGDPRK